MAGRTPSGGTPPPDPINRWRMHVVPLNDLRDHVADMSCWCDPAVSEDGMVVTHHSMDQRELYEPDRPNPRPKS